MRQRDDLSGRFQINVALSRAKARLLLVMSAGDCENEYLGRIARIIEATGRFDDAVALESVTGISSFPKTAIG